MDMSIWGILLINWEKYFSFVLSVQDFKKNDFYLGPFCTPNHIGHRHQLDSHELASRKQFE